MAGQPSSIPHKLTGYCLNPEHPRGKHKARVFASALGFYDGACGDAAIGPARGGRFG